MRTCQRLAPFILDLMVVPEFFDEKRSLLKLPVNRFDLADYLGTVTKSSERAFARLESEGLIRRPDCNACSANSGAVITDIAIRVLARKIKQAPTYAGARLNQPK